MSTDLDRIQSIRPILSNARLGRYEAEVRNLSVPDSRSLALYIWNAKIAASLLVPLHICEVSTRNAVSEALTLTYGKHWPWETHFERSLPSPPHGYNPRSDLIKARVDSTSTGKVIPELKFIFWQKMFTRRHQVRIWQPYLKKVLPFLTLATHVDHDITQIYQRLECIRKLRNRIAHHEPIFTRNIQNDYLQILSLVELRSHEAALWLDENQTTLELLQYKPL
ncbi:MAG: Abi family protein [Pseudomonadota bacterium]